MQPPEFVLFLDENHCNNAHMLRILEGRGIRHERFLRHFTRGLSDSEWLPVVGRQGWCVLTTDKRIRYRALEKQAVQQNKVRMFCFSTNNMSGRQLASSLSKALGAMERIVRDEPAPFIAMLTKGGTVYLKRDFFPDPSDPS